MIYRQLGESDLEVSAIVLGTWAIGGWWWGASDDDLAIEAIRKAVDLGITCIDTAPMYGFGHSESVVGRATKGIRDQVVLATKCGLVWDRTDGEDFFRTVGLDGEKLHVYRVLKKDNILAECDRSLRRLGVDHIDLYQCHWMDKTTALDETMEAMMELKDAGKIRAIGVSNFTPEAIATCLEHGPIISNQPKFSLLSRENLGDVIAWTHEHNIGSIVYSPLEQGVLTGKVTLEREFSEGDNRPSQPWFRPENLRRALEVLARCMQPIADAHEATLAQIAIAWTIGAPGITAAIVGARNVDQVVANAKAADIELSAHEQQTVLSAFEWLGDPAD